MDNTILTLVLALVGLVTGAIVTYLVNQAILRKRSTNIVKEAEAEAEVLKKDKILQAKEKFLQLKSEHEKYINEKNQRIQSSENTLKQREGSISQKLEEIQRKNNDVDTIKENLTHQVEIIERRKEELNNYYFTLFEFLIFQRVMGG